MSQIRGQEIAVIIVLFCGVVVTMDHFIDVPILSTTSSALQQWAVIISGFSLGLGIINIATQHAKKIQNRVPNEWIYSIIFFIGFLVQSAAGFSDLTSLSNPTYIWINENVFNPLTRSMYAILGFFIVSASYRAMRARTLEAALLLLSGFMVMLTNAPIGAVIWSGFPVLGKWILNVPSNAVNRGLLIGVGIGSVLYGIRVLLGKERGYIGGA